MKAKKKKETDWKDICGDMTRLLTFILTHCRNLGTALIYNDDGKSMRTQSVDHWIADTLEKVPGLTVRRDAIGVKNMTKKERAAWDKKQAKEAKP